MTKKDILQVSALTAGPVSKTTCNTPNATPHRHTLKPHATAWLQRLTAFYSTWLGEKTSPRHALRILHAQVALLALLFPFSLSFVVRLLLLLWFVVALLQCRNDE